jgi:hypothetical protein
MSDVSQGALQRCLSGFTIAQTEPITAVNPSAAGAIMTSRERTRRYRARRADGIRLVTIRLTQGDLERLVRAGYLSMSCGNKIGAAVAGMNKETT